MHAWSHTLSPCANNKNQNFYIKKQKIKQIYGEPLALKLLALLGPPVVPYTTSEKFVGPSFYLLINMISSHLWISNPSPLSLSLSLSSAWFLVDYYGNVWWYKSGGPGAHPWSKGGRFSGAQNPEIAKSKLADTRLLQRRVQQISWSSSRPWLQGLLPPTHHIFRHTMLIDFKSFIFKLSN